MKDAQEKLIFLTEYLAGEYEDGDKMMHDAIDAYTDTLQEKYPNGRFDLWEGVSYADYLEQQGGE